MWRDDFEYPAYGKKCGYFRNYGWYGHGETFRRENTNDVFGLESFLNI